VNIACHGFVYGAGLRDGGPQLREIVAELLQIGLVGLALQARLQAPDVRRLRRPGRVGLKPLDAILEPRHPRATGPVLIASIVGQQDVKRQTQGRERKDREEGDDALERPNLIGEMSQQSRVSRGNRDDLALDRHARTQRLRWSVPGILIS
jgi:hypothetical protein